MKTDGGDIKGGGRVGKGTTIYWGKLKIFLILKGPRHCPLVLSVKSCLREGKALGSVFYYEQMRVVEWGLYCV
jgi:hypothetical protein